MPSLSAPAHSSDLTQLKVKPKRTQHVQACALELSAMLGCWASQGDLAGAGQCKDAAKRLHECMMKPVSCLASLAALSRLAAAELTMLAHGGGYDTYSKRAVKLESRPSITTSLGYNPRSAWPSPRPKRLRPLPLARNFVATSKDNHHYPSSTAMSLTPTACLRPLITSKSAGESNETCLRRSPSASRYC